MIVLTTNLTNSCRIDVDTSDSISEIELEEGLFLICGARVDSTGFNCLAKGITTNKSFNKIQFRKVDYFSCLRYSENCCSSNAADQNILIYCCIFLEEGCI